MNRPANLSKTKRLPNRGAFFLCIAVLRSLGRNQTTGAMSTVPVPR